MGIIGQWKGKIKYKSRFIKKLFLILTILMILAISVLFIFTSESWLDEGNYIMKSYWYVSGQVTPYSSEDATFYVPIYFYILGVWQMIFGQGFIVARLLSTLFLIASIFLASHLLYKLTHSLNLLIAFSILFFLFPLNLWYLNTATPYSFVLMITLLIVEILFFLETKRWYYYGLLLGFLFFILYNTRVNMIFGILLFMIYQLLFIKNNKIKIIILELSSIIFLSIPFFIIWGEKYFFCFSQLPVASDILRSLKLLPDPLFLANQNSISVIVKKSMNQILTSFYVAMKSKVIPLFSFSILFSIFLLVKKESKKKYINVLVIYYLVMFVVHLVGSLSYCTGCIQAYSCYFYVFGMMGFILFSNELGLATSIKKFAKKSNKFVYGVLLCILFTNSLNQANSVKKLLSSPRNTYINSIEVLANWIDDYTFGEDFLIIDPYAISSQTQIFLGKRAPISTINQSHSYRKMIIDENDELFYDTLQNISDWSYWTDAMMVNWIENSRYNYLLITDDISDNVFLHSIDKNFTLLDKKNLRFREYTIFIRNDI